MTRPIIHSIVSATDRRTRGNVVVERTHDDRGWHWLLSAPWRGIEQHGIVEFPTSQHALADGINRAPGLLDVFDGLDDPAVAALVDQRRLAHSSRASARRALNVERIVARDRAEHESCELLTPGCCIDHRNDGGGCETW